MSTDMLRPFDQAVPESCPRRPAPLSRIFFNRRRVRLRIDRGSPRSFFGLASTRVACFGGVPGRSPQMPVSEDRHRYLGERLSRTDRQSMREVKGPVLDARAVRQFFVIAMFDTTASPTLGLKSSLRRPLATVTGKVRVMTVR
jgi:hypothetical protein